MKNILNHFRIFSVATFKNIPKYQMVNMFGRYYSDRIIFLMDILDLVYQEVTYPEHLFMIKKFYKVWEAPLRIGLAERNVSIVVNGFEEIDREQLKDTRTRLNG